MNDKQTEYDAVLEKWGKYGALRSGLPFDDAVSFLLNVMESKDLETITGASKVTISRAKHGTGSMRMENLQSIYRFYQEVSAFAITDHDVPDENLVPLYSQSDVAQCIEDVRNARDQIDTMLNVTYRTLQSKLRNIKKDTPKSKLNVSDFYKEKQSRETRVEKSETSNQKEVPPVKEVTNDQGVVYLTNDDEEFFRKPLNESDEEIAKSMGYVKKYKKDYPYLTLHQRYLLEFMSLVQQTPVAPDAGYTIEDVKNIQLPETFWKLHALLGKNDNINLRKANEGRLLERSQPTFNTIEDAVDWVKSIDLWLANHMEFQDDFTDHSAEGNGIELD